jgi:hypothetical protein
LAKIEFYKDEYGSSQALNLLYELETSSLTDEGIRKLYVLILNGLDFMRRHGMPAINSLVELHHEDNYPYSVKLIKDLVRHRDLYEFRINWREAGAFRAIFFQFDYKEDRIIFITKAVVKQGTYSKEFDDFAKESEMINKVVAADPEIYYKGKGEESNE